VGKTSPDWLGNNVMWRLVASRRKEFDPVSNTLQLELVCVTMEFMTKTFWEEYYKVFLVEEINPEMESYADKVSAVGNKPAQPLSPPTSLNDDCRKGAALE
jgi:hypothetical protein